MRCPTCNTVYCDTVVRDTRAGRIIDCPTCGPQFWRVFLPGHPSHPDYQPLRIDAPARRRSSAQRAYRRLAAVQQAQGAQLQRERAATT